MGEAHHGLQGMFSMMNHERLMVGQQGLAVGEVAYQSAANYARERVQGRALSGPKAPDQAADPIIVHPDVRRMLLTARAYNEAARALFGWVCLQVDVSERHPDAAQRERADDLVALLTPVVKAFLTDCGYEAATLCQQVLGGHGYIAEWGMEQLVRDVRISQIYEGANGIHALDLVGRKLSMHDGRLIKRYLGELDTFIADNEDDEAMAEFLAPLEAAFVRLKEATQWVAGAGGSRSGRSRCELLRLPPFDGADGFWRHVGAQCQGRSRQSRGGQHGLLPGQAAHRSILHVAVVATHRGLEGDAGGGRVVVDGAGGGCFLVRT